MTARRLFEDAARAYTAELVNYVLRSGLSEEAARDTVQNALLKAWQVIREGHRPDHLRAWLYRLAHNEMVSQYRRDGTFRRILTKIRHTPGEEDENADVIEAVKELPEPFRQILLLRYCQGLRHDEVAEVLDMPAPTVKVYASRGIAKLRERLGVLENVK